MTRGYANYDTYQLDSIPGNMFDFVLTKYPPYNGYKDETYRWGIDFVPDFYPANCRYRKATTIEYIRGSKEQAYERLKEIIAEYTNRQNDTTSPSD